MIGWGLVGAGKTGRFFSSNKVFGFSSVKEWLAGGD